VITIRTIRSHIFKLAAILESYEHLGVVRVKDAKRGIVKVYSTPDFVDTLEEVLISLKSEGIFVEIIDDEA